MENDCLNQFVQFETYFMSVTITVSLKLMKISRLGGAIANLRLDCSSKQVLMLNMRPPTCMYNEYWLTQ